MAVGRDAFSRPVINLNSVLLPAPLGPIKPVARPASIRSSTPSTARQVHRKSTRDLRLQLAAVESSLGLTTLLESWAGDPARKQVDRGDEHDAEQQRPVPTE